MVKTKESSLELWLGTEGDSYRERNIRRVVVSEIKIKKALDYLDKNYRPFLAEADLDGCLGYHIDGISVARTYLPESQSKSDKTKSSRNFILKFGYDADQKHQLNWVLGKLGLGDLVIR